MPWDMLRSIHDDNLAIACQGVRLLPPAQRFILQIDDSRREIFRPVIVCCALKACKQWIFPKILPMLATDIDGQVWSFRNQVLQATPAIVVQMSENNTLQIGCFDTLLMQLLQDSILIINGDAKKTIEKSCAREITRIITARRLTVIGEECLDKTISSEPLNSSILPNLPSLQQGHKP